MKGNHDQDLEQYQRIEVIDQDQNQDLDHVLRVRTNRDRIRCYRCGEYDHFTRECPNTMTDEESDHRDLDRAALQY